MSSQDHNDIIQEQQQTVDSASDDQAQAQKKKRGIIRRWHSAHVNAAKKLVNTEGMSNIANMTKSLGHSAVHEQCPGCGLATLPAWSTQDEECPECGFVRPYKITPENVEQLRGQFSHLTTEDVKNILTQHISLNRIHIFAAFAALLIAVGFSVYGHGFYSIVIMMLAISQLALGLRHAYYYWIVMEERLYQPNNFKDWFGAQVFWLQKNQIELDLQEELKRRNLAQ